MSVYVIIDIEVKNEGLYFQYVNKVADIVKKYGGRYLARGGKIISMFGDWKPERIILIEFDNMEQIQKCFQSQEYLQIAPFREHSTITKAIIVEGYRIDEGI